MTQKEKTKRYDEALKVIKECIPDKNGFITIYPQEIFPELKESEDERIRKSLLRQYKGFKQTDFYDNGITFGDVVSWLEKQGEKKPTNIDLDTLVIKLEETIGTSPHSRETIKEFFQEAIQKYLNALREASKKIGELVEENYYLKEQKPDKVESKFKVGDWVIFNNHHESIYQIEKIENYRYFLRHYLGGTMSIHFDNELIRLWTIQDAKDGNVLYECNEKKPFIFKELKTKHIGDIASYCDIFNGIFNPNEDDWTTLDIVPATKEQCDILFQKMKEAGYEWDAEKKELKKIEQEPTWSEKYIADVFEKVGLAKIVREQGNDNLTNALQDAMIELSKFIQPKQEWSEEDSKNINSLIGVLDERMNSSDEETIVYDYYKSLQVWLKSLKDRVFPQPKKEWSDEDETRLTNTLIMLKEGASLHFNKKDITKTVDWLKSLRPQNQWKPTEEQIKALRWILNNIPYNIHKEEISGLLEQIQNL